VVSASVSKPGCPGNDLWSAALDYLRRGWSVVATCGKKPRFEWKPFQRERAHPDLVRDWFGGRFTDIDGIGVICGPVSGGLTIRDFDDADAYQRWTRAHPRLARTLPTSQTRRGFHVYCRTNQARIIKLADGELRGAGYCLLPPSRHPSGICYTWIVPPPDALPRVDPRKAGLLPTHTQAKTQADPSHSLHVSDSGVAGVEIAIRETVPTGPGQRNRRLFDLARRLKAIMPGATIDELEIIVREWHLRALPKIRTKDWLESWIDFRTAWARVKKPSGATMAAIVAVARQQAPPDADAIAQLVALCRALQAHHGAGRAWPLSCRMAGEQIGVSHDTAARLFKMLRAEGLIELVTLAGPKGSQIAAEYRFLAPEQGEKHP